MKKIIIGILTLFGLILGIYLGGKASGGMVWLLFGDSGNFQAGYLIIVCISAISFSLGTLFITTSIANKTIYKGKNEFVSMMINNIFAMVIHLIICIFSLNIFLENVFIFLAILFLYPVMGYFSINHGSAIKNYLSLFGGTFLGLLIWIILKPWEYINQPFISGGINLIPFFYLNPFAFLGKIGAPKWVFMITTFAPSLLTWVGLELKQNKINANHGVDRQLSQQY